MKRKTILCIFIIAIISTVGLYKVKAEKLYLHDFHIKSALMVENSGEEISSSSFSPVNWYPARVPTTVLSALVQNGVYPDPYIGMNNMKIPDASPEFSREYKLDKYSHLPEDQNPWQDAYWYRSKFELPDSMKNENIWLSFEGINYRADLWLNGNKIADSKMMVGMFKEYRFNISRYINRDRENYLAVKIHPLDYPGIPAPPQLKAFGPFGPNGGPTGDIGKNVTMQSAVGWDWIPAVRDRNMGIWQDVYLENTGSVDIENTQVITDLPLPSLKSADLLINTEVRNLSDRKVNGIVDLEISPVNFRGETVKLSHEIELEKNERKGLHFLPENYPELRIDNPELWWPNNYGRQNLYRLKVNFRLKNSLDSSYSDQEIIDFGIREIETDITATGKFSLFARNRWYRRDFLINGKEIEIRGGAWVPDMMLNRDADRIEKELRLYKEANLNLVRVWGGGVTPPEEFFAAADRMGLLVWHDFWITGDCQGTWNKGSRDWPLEGDVFLDNAADIVRRLRNHPSILLWTAGNEGYPRKDIYTILRDDIIVNLDGTRPFLPSSGYATPPSEWGLSWPDNSAAGTYSGGPYQWVDPVWYYRAVDRGEDWLFKNEVGIPSVPPYASLKEFLPELSPLQNKFPLSNVWGYHDACEGNGKFSIYHQAVKNRYGEILSVSDYAEKAQLVNANSYRAMFEAVNKDMSKTGGIILWKTSPAWPSVIWQLYDWYLRPNAGYYYVKRANEPIHIQLSLDEYQLSVVNNSDSVLENANVYSAIYDFDMNMVSEKSKNTTIKAKQVQNVYKISIKNTASSPCFVYLELKDKNNQILSRNFYWIAEDNDFSRLRGLSISKIKINKELKIEDGEYLLELNLQNKSNQLAFFINPVILDGRPDDMDNPRENEILPTYWDDNYFSILPGKSRKISARFPAENVLDSPVILIQGWNIESTIEEF